MISRYTIGVDYGTNSVRAVVVDCANGEEISAHVFDYPFGHQGILLDKKGHNLARQNPADYVAGLEKSVTAALAKAKRTRGFKPEQVIGIGVDTTGSTPIPVDKNLVPLAFDKKWKKNLAAQAWLWKDHTGAPEAQKITSVARRMRPDYLAKYGGTYSSEWYWSKLWHCINVAPEVFDAAYLWIEFADWVPAVLCGVRDPANLKPGMCPAGHKALYNEEWGGYPDAEFLGALDPRLAAYRALMPQKAWTLDAKAGELCAA